MSTPHERQFKKQAKAYLRLQEGWKPPKNKKSIEERAKEMGIDLEYHLKED